MEIMDVYVFNLCFDWLLYFSWIEPRAKMIHARLSLIWYLFEQKFTKKEKVHIVG
jgi:hypothetical protein